MIIDVSVPMEPRGKNGVGEQGRRKVRSTEQVGGHSERERRETDRQTGRE